MGFALRVMACVEVLSGCGKVVGGVHTFLPQAHLYLQGLKVIRDICFGLSAHSFARPLLEAIQLLVDIHFEGVARVIDREIVIDISGGAGTLRGDLRGCRFPKALMGRQQERPQRNNPVWEACSVCKTILERELSFQITKDACRCKWSPLKVPERMSQIHWWVLSE